MDAVPEGSKHEVPIIFTRNDLVKFIRKCPFKNLESKFDYMWEEVKNASGIKEFSGNSRQTLRDFISQYKAKWSSSSRNYLEFCRKNRSWLEFSVSFFKQPVQKSSGRPQIEFWESSERSKRRKTSKLRSEFSPEELIYAAQMQLRAEGKVDSANVLKDIVFSNPTKAPHYKQAIAMQYCQAKCLSADKALSMLVEAKLTKFQYNIIRNTAKNQICNIYPNYESVTLAKNRCYPDNLKIDEAIAKVPLQDLLNHSASRLIKSLKEVISSLSNENLLNLQLVSKWGCNGSSGINEYKQKFTDPTISDANIFFTSVVPIQLLLDNPNCNKTVIWQNTKPSSPRYCRPIRIQLVHETTEITIIEKQHIDNQIANLNPTKIHFENVSLIVKHKLLFTMVDSKIFNAISGNSSTQKCYLCGLTSRNFNNINVVLKTEILDKSRLQFGLSSLHAWIRFFECVLHLAYKLVICQWQARGFENKAKVAKNEKRIQGLFRSEMGLIVDKPKPGFGSSNDGNTARRFFNDPKTASRVTGVEEDLITKFKIILTTISSGYNIKLESFRNYCFLTFKRFVELYPWYHLPTSVHKILIHSSEIIDHFGILPIGQLGEEAQESRNKDIKRYRECFARNFSRKQNMEDIFHNLLVSSDPFISGLRKPNIKTFKEFPSEVIAFLDPPKIE